MKLNRMSPILVVLLVLLGSAVTWAQKKEMKDIVGVAAGNIKWQEMKGGPPGIMYSNLWGDVITGAYGAFIKLPAGMKNPLHTHSSDIKLVVISGTFWYAPEAGGESKLGAGSYLFMPAGVKHTSGTVEGSDCVTFQESSGKFDLLPVGAPMEKPMEKK